MNLPNALTLLRLILVPGFLVAVIYEKIAAALGIFVWAGITDFLDGYLARRLKQETPLGARLDPVADKLLLNVAFIALAAKGMLPAWLAVLVVARDFFILIGLAWLGFLGRQISTTPSRWGKLATFMQMVSVGIALLYAVGGMHPDRLTLLYGATGLATAISGFLYVVHRGLNSHAS